MVQPLLIKAHLEGHMSNHVPAAERSFNRLTQSSPLRKQAAGCWLKCVCRLKLGWRLSPRCGFCACERACAPLITDGAVMTNQQPFQLLNLLIWRAGGCWQGVGRERWGQHGRERPRAVESEAAAAAESESERGDAQRAAVRLRCLPLLKLHPRHTAVSGSGSELFLLSLQRFTAHETSGQVSSTFFTFLFVPTKLFLCGM